MNKKQEAEIKDKILTEIEKTEKNIIAYKENTKPIAPENAIGRISRMDAINNKSVAEAALRQSEEKLKKLKIMLTRIEKDNFGVCARCNNEIPFGRLMLMPQSHLCVKCAK